LCREVHSRKKLIEMMRLHVNMRHEKLRSSRIQSQDRCSWLPEGSLLSLASPWPLTQSTSDPASGPIISQRSSKEHDLDSQSSSVLVRRCEVVYAYKASVSTTSTVDATFDANVASLTRKKVRKVNAISIHTLSQCRNLDLGYNGCQLNRLPMLQYSCR
jgi:hypothetical protein